MENHKNSNNHRVITNDCALEIVMFQGKLINHKGRKCTSNTTLQ
ncbi:hypothetical protein D1AOALGA4SA_10408 [Olavius algarvensis Delta 1 endosymbiont]|nr:hypothetical protein D1AOALGA4SA_10408 [Olavius algarvensis Delta 1 endosymbiont]